MRPGTQRKGLPEKEGAPLPLIWEQRSSCWGNKEIQRAKSHQLVIWCNRWGQLAHGKVPSLFMSQHFWDSCCTRPGTTGTWAFPIRSPDPGDERVISPSQSQQRRPGDGSRSGEPLKEHPPLRKLRMASFKSVHLSQDLRKNKN